MRSTLSGARAKEYGQEWNRRERAERAARGSCTRCGKHPAVPGRKSCEPCLEKHRAADRAKYAAGKAAGLKYGGADPEAKRRAGRAKGRRRQKARLEAGTCIRCGKRPPVEEGTTCRPCRDRRQEAEKRKYAERKAARLCTRCAGPVSDGLTLCAPCGTVDRACRDPERKNARSRRLYARRRAAGNCTSCGAPSQGAARCGPCAERSYHGSQQFKGIPVWEPTYMVIELETGREHGPFDDPADVALCLAFEKLARDEVEWSGTRARSRRWRVGNDTRRPAPQGSRRRVLTWTSCRPAAGWTRTAPRCAAGRRPPGAGIP